jgi:hypothetical protein
MSGRTTDAVTRRTASGWMIDISQMQKGTYFVQIHSTNGVKRCHLIR